MQYIGFALDAGRVEMILASEDIDQVREDLQDWADTHLPDYTWVAEAVEFTNCRAPHEVAESIKRVRQLQHFEAESRVLPQLEEELKNLSGEYVDQDGNVKPIEIAA